MTSNGTTPYILLRLLEDRSCIRLKPEYLRSWYAERAATTPFDANDREALYAALVDDFLNKDIAITSKPVLPDDYGQEPLSSFPAIQQRHSGVVLQIKDTLDISHSTHSLLDNFSAVTTVRSVYTSREADDEVSFKRGVLRWTLTDGTKEVQALEFKTISQLNLTTPFGCKNCQVRRGVLLLDPSKIKVLGGQVPALYQDNMAAELRRRLQMRLGLSTDNQQLEPSATRPAPPQIEPMPIQNERIPIRDEQIPIQIEDEFDDDLDDANMEELDEIENAMQTVGLQINQTTLRSTTALSPPSTIDRNILTPSPPSIPPSKSYYTPPSVNSPPAVSKSKFKSFTSQYAYQSSQSDASVLPTASTSKPSMPPPTAHKQMKELEPPLSSANNDSADLDWIGTSVWGVLDGEEDPIVKKEISTQPDGKKLTSVAHIKKILDAMQNNQPIDFDSDQILVEAKARKLANLKLTPSNGFHLVVHLVDPLTLDMENEILVVFGNKVITQLIGMTHHEVIEMNKTRGKREVASKVFKPFQDKLKSTRAFIELDLSLTEQSSTYSVLMPAVISYKEDK
ncbi:recQ-mediated genome instability protein 1 [Apophysomyces sp. BC1034]|nr:recQ-mediated genome instability protein 1 [Apophysomyces sp. BC1015]KAG0167114.1 recQ-mediated genome instability protein 1 [Apophysomyces sp. BC1021]KAG0183800.1 recQ-mediated genome instability protein 1 [Apophysomyces sp. BC1034]